MSEMKTKLKSIYKDFVESIEHHIIAKNAFINAIVIWLSNNLNKLDGNLVTKYGLVKYINIKATDFPIENSEMDPAEEFRQMHDIPPSTEDNFVMRLRDIIWQSITYRAGVICPQCESDELKVLIDPNAPSPSIVLACDICTWAQWPNGRKWVGFSVLKPATKKQLKAGGYLVAV